MSYIKRRDMVIVRQRPRRAVPMGDFFDDLTAGIGGGLGRLIGLGPQDPGTQFAKAAADADAQQNAELSTCLASANASVASLDAQIDDISKNWQPSGFFSPSQVAQITQVGMGLVGQALEALRQAGDQALAADAQGQLNDAADQLHRKGQEVLAFTQIDTTATVIEAPGLKRWIVTTMQACRDAFTTGSVIACNRPGWMVIVGAFEIAFSAWVAAVKAMAEVVVELGAKIQKIPDTIATIYTLAKVGILAGLGYLAYTEYQKYKRGA